MSYAVLCGLSAFAFIGTVIQWAWIWVLIKKLSFLEERLYSELAKLSQQIPTNHAKNAGYNATPKI